MTHNVVLLSYVMSTQDLYRWFDASGELLYVGISLNAYNRAKGHQQKSEWFSDAVTMTVERYATRAEVLNAERVAIIKEHPKHNVAHARSSLGTITPRQISYIHLLQEKLDLPQTPRSVLKYYSVGFARDLISALRAGKSVEPEDVSDARYRTETSTVPEAVETLRLGSRIHDHQIRERAARALRKRGWSKSDVDYVADWSRFSKPDDVPRWLWKIAIQRWRTVLGPVRHDGPIRYLEAEWGYPTQFERRQAEQDLLQHYREDEVDFSEEQAFMDSVAGRLYGSLGGVI